MMKGSVQRSAIQEQLIEALLMITHNLFSCKNKKTIQFLVEKKNTNNKKAAYLELCNCSRVTPFQSEDPKRVTGKQCRPRSDATKNGI